MGCGTSAFELPPELARERLAKLLDDAQASGAFSAQILAPADALQVDGVGAVQIPVRAPLAKS